MLKPRPAMQQGPNLWHFSALAWSTPSRIDGWTMIAAIAAGSPILSSSIAYDKSSGALANFREQG